MKKTTPRTKPTKKPKKTIKFNISSPKREVFLEKEVKRFSELLQNKIIECNTLTIDKDNLKKQLDEKEEKIKNFKPEIKYSDRYVCVNCGEDYLYKERAQECCEDYVQMKKIEEFNEFKDNNIKLTKEVSELRTELNTYKNNQEIKDKQVKSYKPKPDEIICEKYGTDSCRIAIGENIRNLLSTYIYKLPTSIFNSGPTNIYHGKFICTNRIFKVSELGRIGSLNDERLLRDGEVIIEPYNKKVPVNVEELQIFFQDNFETIIEYVKKETLLGK